MTSHDNPWLAINPGDYDAHMSHPAVMQTQALEQIIREQFALIAAEERSTATAAILGITNGNGLRYSDFGRVIGVDINQSFLDECAARYPDLHGSFVPLCIDLIAQWCEAASALSGADLIIANLLIEHIGLDHFVRIVEALAQARVLVSCVIQVNPDGSIASHSGSEHAFDVVVTQVREIADTALSAAMVEIGFELCSRKAYDLPKGKQFIRLDYAKGSPK